MSHDELPTRVERPVFDRETVSNEPRPRTDSATPLSTSGTSPTTGMGSRMGTVHSPNEALRVDELDRFKLFYWAIVAIVVLTAGSLPILPGDETAKWLFVAGMLSYGVGATWLRWVVHDPAQYFVDRNLIIAAIPSVFAGLAGMYYWGVFGPAPVVIAVGLYINSLVGSLKYTLSMYVLHASAHLGLSVAVIAGVVPDVGIIHAHYVDTSTKVGSTIVIQLVILFAFVGARGARKQSLRNMAELDKAVRGMAHREALLNEAKNELRRAAWVGGPGRFTEQVVGSFELGNIIGRGAMGEVYEAHHVETAEDAAVKLLHRNVLADAHHVARFAREAQAAAALDSQHVVKVLEVSREDAAVPYLAMERLHGYDLATHLRRKRRVSLAEAVVLVRHVARGLDAARAEGIVHRDLKPHNVFHADDKAAGPIWKILDFGVSKLSEHGGTLTSGAIVGTPSYMAPEQARGQNVDHRADVYALGAIAYRALTGHPPYPGKDLAKTVHDVVYKMPPRPSSLVTLPSEVDAILAIAMAKDRDDRFATAIELAEALEAVEAGALGPSIKHRAARLLTDLDWGERRRSS